MSAKDESIVHFAKMGFFFITNLIFFIGFAITTAVYYYSGNVAMTMIWGSVAAVSGFRLLCKFVGANDF
jgi:hypothetical protein